MVVTLNTTVSDTNVILSPTIQLINDSYQYFSYSAELVDAGGFPTYQRYGLVDLCFCGGSNGSGAYQADIATWYGFGVTRSYYYPWRFDNYVVMRVWPDTNLVGKQIRLYLWKL